MNMMKKSSEDVVARVNGMKRVSLALKATSQDVEESSDDGASTYVASEKEKRKSHSECLVLPTIIGGRKETLDQMQQRTREEKAQV